MIRRIRLVSGLIMFAFVTVHLLNHALLLVSIDVAEDAMGGLYRVYTSRLGSTALYGAFLAHFLLAL
jgi:adenylate cyclase